MYGNRELMFKWGSRPEFEGGDWHDWCGLGNFVKQWGALCFAIVLCSTLSSVCVYVHVCVCACVSN